MAGITLSTHNNMQRIVDFTASADRQINLFDVVLLLQCSESSARHYLKRLAEIGCMARSKKPAFGHAPTYSLGPVRDVPKAVASLQPPSIGSTEDSVKVRFVQAVQLGMKRDFLVAALFGPCKAT